MINAPNRSPLRLRPLDNLSKSAVYHIYQCTGLTRRSSALGLGDIPRKGFISSDLMADAPLLVP